MPLCVIVETYPNAEGWKAGDIVDITNPDVLIKQGKVLPVDSQSQAGPPFICPICGFKAKTRLGFTSHMRKHINEQAKAKGKGKTKK